MANQQPNYRAYTVVKREGQDDLRTADFLPLHRPSIRVERSRRERRLLRPSRKRHGRDYQTRNRQVRLPPGMRGVRRIASAPLPAAHAAGKSCFRSKGRGLVYYPHCKIGKVPRPQNPKLSPQCNDRASRRGVKAPLSSLPRIGPWSLFGRADCS